MPMGLVLLAVLIVLEMSFAGLYIHAMSNRWKHRKVIRIRSFIRIGVFLTYALLVATTVIDWGFRSYAPAAFLFLLVAVAVVTLLQSPHQEKPYRKARLLGKTIGMVTIYFLITLPAILFPEHQNLQPTGSYPVATAVYTLTDTTRVETYTTTGESRKITIAMWYPQGADGKYPLVIFSHGAFGIKSSNESLYRELASHGYVVCSLDHTYQALFTKDQSGHTTWINRHYMQEISREDARTDPELSFTLYQKWMKLRMDDLNVVIDDILEQARQVEADPVYRLIDTTRIGVMGHSLGGSAALGIGRMRADVRAVVALESPFLADIEGVKDKKFTFNETAYPVPVLNVYSDSSWSHLAEWPQYGENYRLLVDGGSDTYSVYISGAGHLTLTDLALTSPLLTRLLNGRPAPLAATDCLRKLNALCLAFFDYYLKDTGVFTGQ